MSWEVAKILNKFCGTTIHFTVTRKEPLGIIASFIFILWVANTTVERYISNQMFSAILKGTLDLQAPQDSATQGVCISWLGGNLISLQTVFLLEIMISKKWSSST
jgi:hypothetical protein